MWTRSPPKPRALTRRWRLRRSSRCPASRSGLHQLRKYSSLPGGPRQGLHGRDPDVQGEPGGRLNMDVLSACSSFFRSVLRRNPHQHSSTSRALLRSRVPPGFPVVWRSTSPPWRGSSRSRDTLSPTKSKNSEISALFPLV